MTRIHRRAVRSCSAEWGRRIRLLSAAIVGVLSAGAEPVSAQWTQFGGTGQNFTADSRGIAHEWPAEGPPKVWERDLGDGYSAILADGNRLYTMYRADKRERIICLDAKTGKTIWEYAYDSAPREGHENSFGRGPRATPLLVGRHLYTIGVASMMHCLDRQTGRVLWKHDLWTEFGGNVLNHGYASSPIPYRNTVIALVGGKNASIVAFRQDTGDVVWKNQSFKNSYSTPRILNVDGEEQLVTFMAEEIIGVNPTNGTLRWRFAHANQWKQNVCMPVMSDKQHIFLSSPDAGARGLKLVREGDTTRVEEIWSTRKIQFYHTTSIQDGDFVYGSTGTMGPAFLAAVNIETGKIAWRKRGFSKATSLRVDGHHLILDEDGTLALTTVSPEDIKVHSQFQLFDDTSWTVPTVVGKTLFARNKKRIVALDLS